MASVAVGAKTARACDSCLRTRARWRCAAADAFLCQSCDSSVHLANSLARWHERVRLKTSSTSSTPKAHLAIDEIVDDEPTWHHGCKRKARTPSGGRWNEHLEGRRVKFRAVVPEIGTPSSEEECTVMDEEEQLIHRVPIYHPMLSEFCSPPATSDDVKPELAGSQPMHGMGSFEGQLPGLLAPDMDLAEYEMDMESLLGRGPDEESFCMKGLGLKLLMDSPEEGNGSGGGEACSSMEKHGTVKEEEMYVDDAELANASFDCGSPWTGGDASDEDNKAIGMAVAEEGNKRKIMLRLDYESVITAWSTRGSPWANGERPKLDSNDCFPDYMGMIWAGGAELQGGVCAGRVSQTIIAGDGGREARVSRYREKRRTRLFSKKIRYEVRKLNAEKRPRMKGRFVKRTSFAASATTMGAATATVAAPQFVI